MTYLVLSFEASFIHSGNNMYEHLLHAGSMLGTEDNSGEGKGHSLTKLTLCEAMYVSFSKNLQLL